MTTKKLRLKNGDPESHVTVIITSAKKAADDARNVRVDTARGSDNDQQNLSKLIM